MHVCVLVVLTIKNTYIRIWTRRTPYRTSSHNPPLVVPHLIPYPEGQGQLPTNGSLYGAGRGGALGTRDMPLAMLSWSLRGFTSMSLSLVSFFFFSVGVRYIYIYIYICIYIYIYKYFMYIYIYIYINSLCIYIYIYIYAICTHIYIYIYTHMYTSMYAGVLWRRWRPVVRRDRRRDRVTECYEPICMQKASAYMYIIFYIHRHIRHRALRRGASGLLKTALRPLYTIPFFFTVNFSLDIVISVAGPPRRSTAKSI